MRAPHTGAPAPVTPPLRSLPSPSLRLFSPFYKLLVFSEIVPQKFTLNNCLKTILSGIISIVCYQRSFSEHVEHRECIAIKSHYLGGKKDFLVLFHVNFVFSMLFQSLLGTRSLSHLSYSLFFFFFIFTASLKVSGS